MVSGDGHMTMTMDTIHCIGWATELGATFKMYSYEELNPLSAPVGGDEQDVAAELDIIRLTVSSCASVHLDWLKTLCCKNTERICEGCLKSVTLYCQVTMIVMT